MALSIVQQLVLSPGGDDDMGTLLGKFFRLRANCPNPPYHNGLHVYISMFISSESGIQG